MPATRSRADTLDAAAASSLGRIMLTSLTRIGDFAERPVEVKEIPRHAWSTGDYVIGEVLGSGSVPYEIEAPNGRAVEVAPGDLVLGALGRRAATLQIVGDWRAVRSGRLETLSRAGVLGRCTSVARPAPPIADLAYRGHASRDGETISMADFVDDDRTAELKAPVVLIFGTSMSAGKTVSGKLIVRLLRHRGLRVAAAKLTGVGRYRDVLAMRDAGADVIFDFVDAGLPSTAVSADAFSAATRTVLSMVAREEPDVLVVEAGASPLEPYNGATAIELLGDRIAFTVLCASDPYAVVGLIEAFGTEPDVVSGLATSTSAGIELIERLTGRPALNMLDPAAAAELEPTLVEALGVTAEP
jgi:hypothetical protein